MPLVQMTHQLVRNVIVNTFDDILRQKGTGRPRIFSSTELLDMFILMCRTCQPWHLLPVPRGTASTLHRNFMQLTRQGAFGLIHDRLVRLYSHHRKSKHHITDTSYIKNVLGHDVIGRNHTDRGRFATKLSTVTDDIGVTLMFQLFPGNKSDQKVLPETLNGRRPPRGLEFFADKGYDSRANRAFIRSLGYNERISKRGQRRGHNANRKRIRIEHSYARLKQFRHLRQRYDRLAIAYASFVVIANAVVISQVMTKMGI